MVKTVIALAAAAASISAAHADITVSNSDALVREVRRAAEGETIIIRDGDYYVSDVRIERSLTIIGEGDVTLYTTGDVAKGILNPVRRASLRVENITFRAATAPDKNGAGIRHDGVDLTIVNCHFIDNENAILATGKPEGEIRIETSSFVNNGYGDGYSHGLYVVRATALDIKNSRFTGTNIGHHIKSLAKKTSVTGTLIDDQEGAASYVLDASRGGEVVFTGNKIIRAADSSNSTLINYSTARGGAPVRLVIKNNEIINNRRNAKLLRNASNLSPQIGGNDVTNIGKATLKMRR